MPVRSMQLQTPAAATRSHFEAAASRESGATASIASAPDCTAKKDASIAATRNAALKKFPADGIGRPPGAGM
jgi:hypothetical protein